MIISLYFKKGKSTHFAIMLLTDKITEVLDRGECLIDVFLDFLKHSMR